jgi:hypothetical protein
MTDATAQNPKTFYPLKKSALSHGKERYDMKRIVMPQKEARHNRAPK